MNNKEFEKFANYDYKSFSNYLSSIDPYEFTLIGTILGFLISKPLTINEQNSLGNFFTLIGQILQTVNGQAITNAQKDKEFSNFKPYLQKDNLKEEVAYLKEEVYKIIQEAYGFMKP